MDPAETRRRGRPRGFDLDGALDRAVQVFWRRGYAGAGIAELTAAMAISPPSLYAAFGDKRGLFLAALDRYANTVGSGPLAVLRGEGDRDARIRAFLAATVALTFETDRGRGCFAACVACDAAGDDEAIRESLAALMSTSEAALGEAAGQGGPSGRALLAAMHAIAVRARAGAARAEVKALAEELGDQLRGAARTGARSP